MKAQEKGHKLYILAIIISKNTHFRFVQLIIYMVFILNHVHYLINEYKILIFTYNSNRKV